MMLRNLIYISLILVFVVNCEREFTPDINSAAPEIVVEGYIEAGEQPTSPFVILTRSTPFFSEIDITGINDIFVHDAIIEVNNGDRSVTLEEICLDDLTEDQKQIAGDLFGIDADSISINFCVYFDITLSMFGEVGKTYELEIKVDDQLISASTKAVEHSPLQNIYFTDVPGVPSDTLRELRVFLDDRPNEANFYRYFTETNSEGFLAPFGSVFDDAFFDGDYFEFPMPKAEADGTEFNIESFGYYVVGDTATIKFTSIDDPHYRFWSTLEFNRANQGPFSSYTRVESNINGGLGIWGAYTTSFHELIVE